MKKVLLLLVTLVFAVAMIACNDIESDTQPTLNNHGGFGGESSGGNVGHSAGMSSSLGNPDGFSPFLLDQFNQGSGDALPQPNFYYDGEYSDEIAADQDEF